MFVEEEQRKENRGAKVERIPSKSKQVSKEQDKPAYKRPQRNVEQYAGEPPSGSEQDKTPIQFRIRGRKCGIHDELIPGKTCKLNLLVQRVKNQKFERDEHGQGGQIIYDEKDIRQYIYCTTHGPFPIGDPSW